MTGTRAAIARLSLTVRVLLYAAMLFAIGYMGFSYSSGYVAISGDNAFAMPLPPGLPATPGGDVLLRVLPGEAGLRTAFIVCDDTITKDETGKTGTAEKNAEQRPKSLPCPPPSLSVRPIPGGPDAVFVVTYSKDGTSVSIERKGSGAEAKGTISVTRDGKTTKSNFTGTAVPDEILKVLPDNLKTQTQELLVQPPGTPMSDIFFMRAPFMYGPGNTAPLAPRAEGGGEAGNGRPPTPAAPSWTPGTKFEVPLAPPDQLRLQDGTWQMPVGGVVSFPGPALLQQQVRGHTAIRATLVGITIALVVLAIIQLERLLAHFQQSELFSARNSGLLRNIGLLLLAVAFVQATATLLPAILVHALHPVLIGALGPHLFLIFAGLILCLLAQLMSEAARLEDEAAHTV